MSLSWEALVRLTDAEVNQLDVALVNRACAKGLPHLASLGAEGVCARLDYSAHFVHQHSEHQKAAEFLKPKVEA